jgi:hypothetical protein
MLGVGGRTELRVASGDFNGDGKPDLAVANPGSWDSSSQTYTNSGIRVLLSEGDGRFQNPVNHPVGTNPVYVFTSDFNRDGKTDLATVNAGLNHGTPAAGRRGSVSVLLGGGDGSFQNAVHYDAASSPSFAGLGDLNTDGNLDLAIATSDANGLSLGMSVLFGKGDGTFEATAPSIAGAVWTHGSLSTAQGDFNGDGFMDLAQPNLSKVSVRLSKGDGTLGSAFNYEVLAQLLTVGDFNGDGRTDLAALGQEFDPGYVAKVTIMLSLADGTFRTIISYGLGSYPYAVAVNDLNGDGISDLAVASGGASPQLSVMLGKGDGTFRAFSLNTSAFVVAVGDVNNDGRPDLVTSGYGDSWVLINLGVSASSALEFAHLGDFQAGGYGGTAVAGDFNGDGTPDLAVGDDDPSERIAVLLSRGDGFFQPAVRYISGPRTAEMAVGDFNSDCKLDLAVANGGLWDSNSQTYTNSGISVLLGKGDGSFGTRTNFYSGGTSRSVAVADFNGDHNPDLAVANFDEAKVSVLFGKGGGAFGTPAGHVAGTEPVSVAVGDFNGDSKFDLAVADNGSWDSRSDSYTNSGIAVLVGNGDGTFQTAVGYATGPGSRFVLVSDFNSDGTSDLAVANQDGVSVLLGRGNGTFHAAVSYDATSASSLATGDLNGDGKIDLIAVGHGASYSPGGRSILLGKGDGTFQRAITSVGHSLSSVVIGDFNRDAKLDFVTVWSNDIAGTPASVWLNTACSASPSLDVVHIRNALTVSWPFPSEGFGLEWSASLAPASWSRADISPVKQNGRLEITVPLNGGHGFFRLLKP